jgi:Ala-tRNA(Pro) deacylase
VREPVLAALRTLDIQYELFEHPPVNTGEEAAVHWQTIRGAAVKNLFLRNKKGDRHYLVILGIDKQADLRQLVKVIGDDRLSFGSPERLEKYLGVTPGSVSPLGLIHDTGRAVRVIIDSDLRTAERLIFHPNDNTASLTISGADFLRFLEDRGNTVRWVKL